MLSVKVKKGNSCNMYKMSLANCWFRSIACLRRAKFYTKRFFKKYQMDFFSRTRLKAGGATLLYGACSFSMAFVNKALLTTVHFDYPIFIMTVQMIFTVLILNLLKAVGLINMKHYTLPNGRAFALPSLFYGLNSIFALSALSHMNFTIYGVLKRCTPIVTIIISYFILKKNAPSKLTATSVTLITIGCITAGYGDLTFEPTAYIFGVLSVISQAVYLLLVQTATQEKFGVVQTLQLNSVNTLPLLLVGLLATGEFTKLMNYTGFSDVSFIILFPLTISMGCFLNYSLFLCTSVTSALTTSVTGVIKAILQTVVGTVSFGGISHNISTFVGISMNSAGCIMYVLAKVIDEKAKPTRHEETEVADDVPDDVNVHKV